MGNIQWEIFNGKYSMGNIQWEIFNGKYSMGNIQWEIFKPRVIAGREGQAFISAENPSPQENVKGGNLNLVMLHRA